MKPKAIPIPEMTDRRQQLLLKSGGDPLDASGYREHLHFHSVTGQDLENTFLDRLREEIGHLPPQDRAILFLCAAQRRYGEIASALSLPAESIRRRIARAREQLRSRLFVEADISGRLAAQPPGKTGV